MENYFQNNDNDPKNLNDNENKINKPYKKPQSTFPS